MEDVRILVVEDDAQLRSALATGLREEGYLTEESGDGDDGAYQACVGEYDLIVLDVTLPGRDGFAVCRELREAGVKACVLMLTARDGVEDKISGLDAGADDYLTKPFAFAELLARLRALLRRGGGGSELRVADLTLDPASRRVTRGGRVLPLSAREYALLEFLMRHPEEVLGRARIAQSVWPLETGLDSNVVDVFVSYLRQKVDKPFPTKLIHTVRGMGYVLRSTD
jgi:two-component system, OmpR family, copper resistance phosphate regulon response regulator CusR